MDLGCECVMLVAMVMAIHSRFGVVKARLGLDSALTSQARVDPLAMNDTFVSLPPAVKKLLLQPSNSDANQKLQQLRSVESTTLVTVKLVGFSTGDRSQLQAQFTRYLDAFNQQGHVPVIGSDPHKLMIKTRIDLSVAMAQKTLADVIFQAIENHLQAQTTSSDSWTDLQAVPHTLLDEIIQTDLEKPLSSYVIYLLNPKHQRVNYAYGYGEDQSCRLCVCLGMSWTSRNRYMWIDLAAGPVHYGPALSGDGLVVKAETHPLAALHKGSMAGSSFLADLASVVWSASQMLLLPPLRIPVHFHEELLVNFIHVSYGGDLNGSQEEYVKWSAIENTFLAENGKSFAFASQSIRFKSYTINAHECTVCAAILARSSKSYASHFLLDKFSLFLDEYIDSKQLHYLLRQNQAEIAKLAGIDSHAILREVPVYVFDLPRGKYAMLDRLHPAIAFEDMVIAMHARRSNTIGTFTCNGRSMMTKGQDLERPIVGALLQTVWGVSPTHVIWSFQHNSSLVDYTWSVGQTPFGPFSNLYSLSFVQRDAAPRNVLFTMLNSLIKIIIDIINSVQDQGGEKKLFGQKEHIQLTQRWNLFLFKVNKALSLITHFDFDSALYFVKSAEHDLIAFHNLVFHATSSQQASIVCFKDPPLPWHWVLAPLILVAIAIYVWNRRDRLFVNKKKKF